MTEQSIIEAAKESGLDLKDPVVATVIRQAVDIGEKQERDRVIAHIQLGGTGSTAGMRLAHKAIENGDDMTPTYGAHYVQAGRAAAEIRAYAEDSAEVEQMLAGAKRPPSTFTDPVAAAVFDQLSAMVGGGGDVAIEDLDEAGG
jgi:hypothetical protein